MNTSLPLRPLTDGLCAAPQMQPEAMAELARLGFRSVINNRPDFEHGPDQPTSAQIQAAAEAAGLQYRHLPVDGGFQTPEQIAAFGELLKTLPGPVLAFCRSGARVARLYQQTLPG